MATSPAPASACPTWTCATSSRPGRDRGRHLHPVRDHRRAAGPQDRADPLRRTRPTPHLRPAGVLPVRRRGPLRRRHGDALARRGPSSAAGRRCRDPAAPTLGPAGVARASTPDVADGEGHPAPGPAHRGTRRLRQEHPRGAVDRQWSGGPGGLAPARSGRQRPGAALDGPDGGTGAHRVLDRRQRVRVRRDELQGDHHPPDPPRDRGAGRLRSPAHHRARRLPRGAFRRVP